MAARMICELHGEHQQPAFTNLFALTRLVTAWKIEPIEAAHYIRFFLAGTAQRALWEALQGPGWPEHELAALQTEWERPDFFRDLPETTAATRAGLLAITDYESKQSALAPLPIRQIASEFLSAPVRAWSDLQGGVNESRYRKYGIYEDQKEIMVYFRERELELRQAIQTSSWLDMRAMPGITNPPAFHGSPRSSLTTRLNGRPTGFGLFRQSYGLARRAAEVKPSGDWQLPPWRWRDIRPGTEAIPTR